MPRLERQEVRVDVVCVGFGPAAGGFLTTLSRAMAEDPIESRAMSGMPLQVLCYERADDIGFGVSGVVTRARGIRASFPGLDLSAIPSAHPVEREKAVYLHDPIGASRRPAGVRFLDTLTRPLRKHHAAELPYVPSFLRKDGGLVMSVGRFNQWVGAQLMGDGMVQVWPGTPVAEALLEGGAVKGVRLVDQGVARDGSPTDGTLPGMDVRATLTVVADGPVGPIGRQLDQALGLPDGRHQREWAVGMKVVVDLPEDTPLRPGTVLHTFGYPEPEIFGFLYVYPGRQASLGIFVPTFFETPIRTAYRYLQHWMRHPYLWRYLGGSTLRSWGAKTLRESGRAGEPRLVGDGFARIGEGSGSTNVLTGSGVDEAWVTGVLLAEAVVELARAGEGFTRANLERTYVRRRRESWVDREGRAAEHARDGFAKGFLSGLLGMAMAGVTGGRIHPAMAARSKPAHERIPTLERYCRDRIPPDELAAVREDAKRRGAPLHDAIMDRLGWPPIEHDGKLLVSHQDALLLGGKVQAAPGYADHIVFLYPNLCEECGERVCVEVCSGQAITPGANGVPEFDREKCVHCGACVWSCSQPRPGAPELGNIEIRAGSGGLHSAEN